MEDIVGIKVHDAELGERAFITWGRVFDSVDPEPLIRTVVPHLQSCGLRAVQSVEVCDSLQEIAHHTYFFEALCSFSVKRPRSKRRYDAWRSKMKARIKKGREIYFLGHPRKPADKPTQENQ